MYRGVARFANTWAPFIGILFHHCGRPGMKIHLDSKFLTFSREICTKIQETNIFHYKKIIMLTSRFFSHPRGGKRKNYAPTYLLFGPLVAILCYYLIKKKDTLLPPVYIINFLIERLG